MKISHIAYIPCATKQNCINLHFHHHGMVCIYWIQEKNTNRTRVCSIIYTIFLRAQNFVPAYIAKTPPIMILQPPLQTVIRRHFECAKWHKNQQHYACVFRKNGHRMCNTVPSLGVVRRFFFFGIERVLCECIGTFPELPVWNYSGCILFTDKCFHFDAFLFLKTIYHHLFVCIQWCICWFCFFNIMRKNIYICIIIIYALAQLKSIHEYIITVCFVIFW